MYYFEHDTGASKDSKILMLRKQHGGAAVDAYWSIIELFYKEECPLTFSGDNPEVFALSMWLCCELEELHAWVDAMVRIGLLEDISDDGEPMTIWSDRVGQRVADYQSKNEIARQNGKKGGRPRKQKTEEKPSENLTETQENPGVSESKPNKTINRIRIEKEIEKKGKEEEEKPLGFPFDCLSIFNEIMGTAYGGMPPDVTRNLRSQEGRYSLDEVRDMITYKRAEWYGTKFQGNLTPQTLFSRSHFEQYIHQSKMPKPKEKGEQAVDYVRECVGDVPF